MVATAALLVLLGAAAPAGAVGVAGIELNPDPPLSRSGQPVTAFRITLRPGQVGHEQALLRNVNQAPASAQLYAAMAVKEASGQYSIGAAGTAPWIELAPQTVSLPAGQQEVIDFRVRRPPSGSTGALVVAATDGAITKRAATLVLVTRAGRDPTVPLVALAAAVVALATAIGLLVARRRGAPR